MLKPLMLIILFATTLNLAKLISPKQSTMQQMPSMTISSTQEEQPIAQTPSYSAELTQQSTTISQSITPTEISTIQEAPQQTIAPPSEPEPIPEPIASGTCSEELTRYEWDQGSAHRVMIQESGGNPSTLNPSGDDYSVGCFQINLKGDSNLAAKYRDSVANGYTGNYDREELRQWLNVPRNNVAVAITMWRSSHWSPWSFTTCKKVLCV